MSTPDFEALAVQAVGRLYIMGVEIGKEALEGVNRVSRANAVAFFRSIAAALRTQYAAGQAEAVARIAARVRRLGDRIEDHLDHAEGCDYGAGDMIRAEADAIAKEAP